MCDSHASCRVRRAPDGGQVVHVVVRRLPPHPRAPASWCAAACGPARPGVNEKVTTWSQQKWCQLLGCVQTDRLDVLGSVNGPISFALATLPFIVCETAPPISGRRATRCHQPSGNSTRIVIDAQPLPFLALGAHHLDERRCHRSHRRPRRPRAAPCRSRSIPSRRSARDGCCRSDSTRDYSPSRASSWRPRSGRPAPLPCSAPDRRCDDLLGNIGFRPVDRRRDCRSGR